MTSQTTRLSTSGQPESRPTAPGATDPTAPNEPRASDADRGLAADAVVIATPRFHETGWFRLVVIYTLLVAGAVAMLVPFFIMLSTSLMPGSEANNPNVVIPSDLVWFNYVEALRQMGFINALANTTFITFFSVVLQVLTCSLVGLGFARFRFRGREAIFMIMLATMMIPAQVTMIPVFLLFRTLGMIDTFWPLIFQSMIGSPFFIFMFRQFFLQIPEDLLEAAKIDGATPLMIYWRLMLPLATPVIAIVAIYTFMFAWNDFLGPLIYLNSPENRTLALALNAFSGQYGVENKNLLMAASFVTMLPCILLFFAAQRYFMNTDTGSGLKG